MKKSEIFFGVIRIPLDFSMAFLAMLAAYYLRSQETLLPFLKKPDLEIFPPFDVFAQKAALGAVLFLIISAFFRMYSLRITTSLTAEMRRIFFAALIWLMAVITYYFLMRGFPFSRAVLFYGFALVFIFAAFGRIFIRLIQRVLLAFGIGVRRVLLFGEGEIALELKNLLESRGVFRILHITNSFSEIQSLVAKNDVDELIQTKEFSHLQAEETLNFCREHHIAYNFVPDILEVSRTNVEVKTFGEIPVISLKPTPLDGWGKILKRAFDFILSAIFLVILSPLFLIIALLIKLDSRGAVFFRYLDDRKTLAKRVGQHGRTFCCLKFRTMRSGTHSLRYSEEFSEKNLRKGSPLIKIENDPRITRVGRFLRRYSLDELPQFWNVLKGEMSLAGPRPHLAEEVGKYKSHHKFVLAIKPGLTGLAQISGRSDLPFEEEIRLDTFYIENWSLLLDLKILLKTVLVVLRGYKE